MGAAGLLKNSYERHCERQSLEAISARLRRVISNLLQQANSACFLLNASFYNDI
jgi:hypothetical protein